MRFDFEGEQFRIWFDHRHYPNGLIRYSAWHSKERVVQAVTHCHLQQLVKGEGWETFRLGTSLCAWDDEYNKETGRVIALRRAIMEWTENKHFLWDPKAARRAAFSAYFNRKR